jgi:hypothetical protein
MCIKVILTEVSKIRGQLELILHSLPARERKLHSGRAFCLLRVLGSWTEPSPPQAVEHGMRGPSFIRRARGAQRKARAPARGFPAPPHACSSQLPARSPAATRSLPASPFPSLPFPSLPAEEGAGRGQRTRAHFLSEARAPPPPRPARGACGGGSRALGHAARAG